MGVFVHAEAPTSDCNSIFMLFYAIYNLVLGTLFFDIH